MEHYNNLPDQLMNTEFNTAISINLITDSNYIYLIIAYMDISMKFKVVKIERTYLKFNCVKTNDNYEINFALLKILITPISIFLYNNDYSLIVPCTGINYNEIIAFIQKYIAYVNTYNKNMIIR